MKSFFLKAVLLQAVGSLLIAVGVLVMIGAVVGGVNKHQSYCSRLAEKRDIARVDLARCVAEDGDCFDLEKQLLTANRKLKEQYCYGW